MTEVQQEQQKTNAISGSMEKLIKEKQQAIYMLHKHEYNNKKVNFKLHVIII